MNTRRAIDDTGGPVALSAAFNEDRSCFSVGLDSGYCVFSSEPCELKVSKDLNGGIGIAQMLGRSNYIAMVGGGKQPRFPNNKVIIWDDLASKVTIRLEFRSPVHQVRLSRSRIVVALQNSIHVWKFASPPEKLSTFETTDNPFGLCCLGSKLLAFPGRTPGQVQIVELERGNVSIIPAHSSPLRALELSPDGEVLATASETGTLIRVFSTANCARMTELRRGVDHATIFSLAISPSNSLLAVTSDKSTLHIFDLVRPLHGPRPSPLPAEVQPGSRGQSPSDEDGSSQKWGILGKIPMLPRVFSDVYSFASAHFELGDEPVSGPGSPKSPAINAVLTGMHGGRPPKGVIGWTSESSLIVLGAGRDGRWERFIISEAPDGRRHCFREGWRRYLGER